MKIAVITGRFNEPVTSKLYDGCIKRLEEQGVTLEDDDIRWVPGVVEIPLIAQRFAQKGYDAIICLGAVIRGETTHYDYVCQQVSYGCQRVALDYDVPVIFGILTTENGDQAFDRVGGKHGHKGKDAADTAMEMIKASA
jgi:6,7-dimethyl-8-ribityllumazine synthase